MHPIKELLKIISEITPNQHLQTLIIIVFFIILAKVVDVLLSKILAPALLKTENKFDDRTLEIFKTPIFYSVVLVGLALVCNRLAMPETLHFIVTSILKTIAICIWSFSLSNFFKLIITVLSGDESRFELIQDRTLPLFNNFVIILVVALAIYFIFLTWHIDLTAWMASAGIIGLAISFAAKDTLANLFSGVFIMVDAPYKLGDFIVLDSGERGEVTHIGIRSTRMLTRDDVEITVPNSVMGNAKITNEAGGPYEKYRIRIKVGVAYGSDLDLVHDVLMNIAIEHPKVCNTPKPRVRFRTFGASSLDHELLCWVERPVLRGKVSHVLNTRIYKRFIKEGIEIPFPQRDIHIIPPPEGAGD
jgi:MscS family membrane protein